MIYKLQKKFIIVCTISILTVITLIFGIILILNISSMNKNIDILADRVSEGGGKFPRAFQDSLYPEKQPSQDKDFNFITPETPYSTRHFTIFFDNNGNVKQTFTESIYSITEDIAIEYAKKALSNNNERGWINRYRYKVFNTNMGMGVVFIDGSMNRSALMQSTTIAGVVLLSCATLVLILIILISGKVVKPIAESYEKQKQFITDVNHELKTPLTLILANLDIAEAELGNNEWLDDIRAEGHRMTELVEQLISLSRMDEDNHKLISNEVSLGKLVLEITSEFEALVKDRNKIIYTDIDSNVTCSGDEAMLYKLVGILLDNAIKYCDEVGDIHISLYKNRKTVLIIENSYSAINEIELNRLFDRFYREDKARKYSGGYGIGLSIAKSIVELHKGEISVYKKDNTHIGFKVIL